MSDDPGALRPDAAVVELRAAIEELQQRVAVLGAPPPVAHQPPLATRPTAFSIMPFGPEDLQIVYDDFVKPTIEKCGLACIRGDDMFGSNVIMEDVRTAINESRIIIADLTGKNANVFYEVGIAHGTGKSVLLLAQSVEDVPFDLRHRRVLVYDYTPRGCKLLERRLEEHVLGMLADVQPPRPSDAEKQALSGMVTSVETELMAGDEALFTFMDAWARPAFEAARRLLGLARDALRGEDNLAKRDLAVLYQRVCDGADRAYSLAFNAVKGLDGSPVPQVAVGDFHREYQGMVTWISKGLDHAVLDPDSSWYQEWYASDARFMDELRQVAARPGRSALRDNLRAAGFNEGIRHKLPVPGRRG